MIQAIETQYKGYRFRSRTEARWAIYFDVCGIKWEYELEGYDLGELGWYLPDFWLPQVNMWAEVKGKEFTTEERLKAIELAKRTGYPVLELVGTPENKWYSAFNYGTYYEWGIDDTEVVEITGSFDCQYYVSDYHGYHEDEHRFYCMPGCETPDDEGVTTDAVLKGIAAARFARFEHGENPQVRR